MRSRSFSPSHLLSLLALGALPASVLADQVLSTSSFSTCQTDSDISVTKLNITYNNDAKTIVFDVAGSSASSQNVTATLNVMAYGNSVYSNSFNPCDASNYVAQLCPGAYCSTRSGGIY